MILGEENIKTIELQILYQAQKKRRKCFGHNCSKKAINSHVIWKKGILSKIAENNHLVELNIQKRPRNGELKFVKTGINKIMSFYGFCSKHDNEFFKDIEKNDVDYSLLKNQILLTIRGLYHEWRKKEIAIEWFQGMLKKGLYPYLEQQLHFEYSIHQHKLGLQDISFYISELNREYLKAKGRFVFKTFELEKIPVVFSSFFAVDGASTMEFNSKINKDWENIPLNSMFAALFPQDEKSIFLIGFHTNYLNNLKTLSKIKNFDKGQLLKLISDIMIERVETWSCSPKFYQKHIKPIEKDIIREFDKDSPNFTETSKQKVNIFANWDE
jgi:hypothetical protein